MAKARCVNTHVRLSCSCICLERGQEDVGDSKCYTNTPISATTTTSQTLTLACEADVVSVVWLTSSRLKSDPRTQEAGLQYLQQGPTTGPDDASQSFTQRSVYNQRESETKCYTSTLKKCVVLKVLITDQQGAVTWQEVRHYCKRFLGRRYPFSSAPCQPLQCRRQFCYQYTCQVQPSAAASGQVFVLLMNCLVSYLWSHVLTYRWAVTSGQVLICFYSATSGQVSWCIDENLSTGW